jgi:hypothetical protein
MNIKFEYAPEIMKVLLDILTADNVTIEHVTLYGNTPVVNVWRDGKHYLTWNEEEFQDLIDYISELADKSAVIV